MTPEELRDAAAVMLAAADGKQVQLRTRGVQYSTEWKDCVCPNWNWHDFDYRVKPEPLECYVIFDEDNHPTRALRHYAAFTIGSGYRIVKMRETETE